MKLVLICISVIVLVKFAHTAMTEAQVKSAVKLMRNVCQPKVKISSAQIEAIHSGTFTQDKEILGYMECILRTGQIMKDGKLNVEALHAQLANLPPSISEGAIASADNCKDQVKSSDKYQAAYEFYKCFYDDNPANFFLP